MLATMLCNNLLSVLTVVSFLLPHARSFSPAPGCRVSSRGMIRTPVLSAPGLPASSSTMCLHSTGGDNQAEIAALEEKLRELKGEEYSPETAPAETDPVPMEDLEAIEALEGESDDSIMFSERWKEAKDDYLTRQEEGVMGGIVQEEGAMGGIAKVALAIGFVAFLAFFSQVPVGEESLQRYQDVKGSPSRIDLGDLNPVQ